MKKLMGIIFLLVINTVFATETPKSCGFINTNDKLLKQVIKKLKKENKINDLFCDADNLKSVYYLIEDGNYELNIGVNIPIKENQTFNELRIDLETKLLEYLNFVTELTNENKKDFKDIEKVNIRFYSFHDKKIIFYFGRYVDNLKTGEAKFIGFGPNKENFDKFGIFENIKVDYSKDENVIF